jgi:hypothetical protein
MSYICVNILLDADQTIAKAYLNLKRKDSAEFSLCTLRKGKYSWNVLKKRSENQHEI